MFPKLSLCLSLVPLNKNWLVPMFLKIEIRSYPSSEFDVANTLAKWKKLKPNEIDFKYQEVVLYLDLTLCQLVAFFDIS